MNIFYCDANPQLCAMAHCDKHVVKMIVEYCQILSTCHRILDGEIQQYITKSGRISKEYLLPDARENILYKASHIHHPSVIWAMQGDKNYLWLHELLLYLNAEYTHRYGKIHLCATKGLIAQLGALPMRINPLETKTEIPQVMPEIYQINGDSIGAYRNYYNLQKYKIAKWTKRTPPAWFTNH